MIIDGSKKVGKAKIFKTPYEMALYNLNLVKDEKIKKLEKEVKDLRTLIEDILFDSELKAIFG